MAPVRFWVKGKLPVPRNEAKRHAVVVGFGFDADVGMNALFWRLAVPLVEVSGATPSEAASNAAANKPTALVMLASKSVYLQI
jgi:hypothetical protein